MLRIALVLLTALQSIAQGAPQDEIKDALALAYIGLNDTAKAKSLLVELYTLDSNYVLDPQQFSPKVMAVASDAKAEQSKLECQAAQDDAQKYLETSKIAA